MKQLLLLILCLLVSFKSFSQKDTISDKKSYVILTEKQAKAVVKDIIHMDALEKTNVELEKRVDNLLKKGLIYDEIIKTKDTIINNKNEIIAIKDEMLDAKRPFEFHGYGGVRTFNLQFGSPILYGRTQFEFKKLNIGAMINFHPIVRTDAFSSSIDYSIYVEYKIF